MLRKIMILSSLLSHENNMDEIKLLSFVIEYKLNII